MTSFTELYTKKVLDIDSPKITHISVNVTHGARKSFSFPCGVSHHMLIWKTSRWKFSKTGVL